MRDPERGEWDLAFKKSAQRRFLFREYALDGGHVVDVAFAVAVDVGQVGLGLAVPGLVAAGGNSVIVGVGVKFGDTALVFCRVADVQPAVAVDVADLFSEVQPVQLGAHLRVIRLCVRS